MHWYTCRTLEQVSTNASVAAALLATEAVAISMWPSMLSVVVVVVVAITRIVLGTKKFDVVMMMWWRCTSWKLKGGKELKLHYFEIIFQHLFQNGFFFTKG
jgi:hypothetical protein